MVKPRVLAIGLAAVLASASQVRAQAAAAPTGAMADPCAGMTPAPPEVVAYRDAMAKAAASGGPAAVAPPEFSAIYNAWNTRRQVEDFADHCRFRAANALLPPATKRRVVFFGDSITDNWLRLDPSLFTGDVINRGISGQTTDQMIGRFRQDVIDLHPAAVHILAGTNDIAGNTGPTSLAQIEGNIRSMVELARANRVRPILSAVTPAARYPWRPQIESVANIMALNDWMRAYAKAEKVTLVDYEGVLGDGKHGIKAELSADGVHPNAAAYRLMRPVVEAAIRAGRQATLGN